MHEIAPDVYVLSSKPKFLFNTYLMGGVLVDSATKLAARGLLRQLKGHTVTAHALTHAHPDHQGSTHAICTALNIPLLCGENDAAVAESGDMSKQLPQNLVTSAMKLLFTGKGHPVERTLREGDEVGGFIVIDTPGHSPGQVAYWRESDRVLILGDVATNMDFVTMRRKLGELPLIYTLDLPQSRASIRKVAALQPRIICFGHGEPLLKPDAFMAFVDSLPDA